MAPDTYYLKRGKRYIPSGYNGPDLFPGIWLVQVTPGCKSQKNLSILLSELPDPTDLQVLAKTVLLEKTILKVMNECWPSNGIGCSLYECAMRIAKALTKEELRLKKMTTKNMRDKL